MYIPKFFEITDKEVIYDFIEHNSFGILVSIRNQRPFATHLPLILDREREILSGHLAIANEQSAELEGKEALVIFQGPHHYISSSWYETRQSVPTWNYVSVHVYGTVELIRDGNDLWQHLLAITKKYERDSTYRIDETNKDFVQSLMRGIVGFRLRMKRCEGKWKLSQNHSPERRERVIQQLESIPSEDARQIAELMRKEMEYSP